MSDTPREDIQVAEAPRRAVKHTPATPPEATKKELTELVNEIGGNPENLREFLAKIPPVDYKKSPETQTESIAGTQAQLIFTLMFGTLDISDEDFAKLTPEKFAEIMIKMKGAPLPKQLEGLKIFESFQALAVNRDTPAGQEILKKWSEMREMASVGRETIKKQMAPAALPASGSTLPPPGTLPTGPAPGGGGLWEGTKDFVKDNKTSLMIGGAALVGIYAAYKLFGGHGSSEESKWFSGITDWKVLTVAGLATAFGLYKWGPDWIRGAFDKFKAFITSEKTSTIEPAKIADMAKRIVEYNNKKDPENRRTGFPEKLIKSKGGMTMAEFKDKDGFFSNAMYTVNSGISWLTGTSGALPNDMKQEWKDYQLLLTYTKDKVAEHKIDVTDDTKMDDVWKKIMEKEGGK